MASRNITNAQIRRVLADNLNALLDQREWTQSELSRRCRVSQKQVNNSARQRTGTGIELIAEMARALGVEPWTLLCPQNLRADKRDGVASQALPTQSSTLKLNGHESGFGRLRRMLDSIAREAAGDLNGTDMRLLCSAAQNPRTNLQDLGRAMQITPSAVSRSASKLEQFGHVAVEEAADSRREKWLRVTQSGAAVLTRIEIDLRKASI